MRIPVEEAEIGKIYNLVWNNWKPGCQMFTIMILDKKEVARGTYVFKVYQIDCAQTYHVEMKTHPEWHKHFEKVG